MTQPAQQATKIGVLMVHGIGQQARYGHLEPEVAALGRALADYAREHQQPPPVIRARSQAPELRGATNSSWGQHGQSPVVIELVRDNQLFELHFREVWWADLDDAPRLSTIVRFYAWALGVWLKPGLDAMPLAGQKLRMRHATRPNAAPTLGAKLWYRAYLMLVAAVVFLALPLSLVARLLRVFFPATPATLLAEYLGDVKLYQDHQRAGADRLEDLDLPPRVSIRARMVHALTEMAMADYDRWYVCAHSLGSVIAFNALMETEQSLPNYLDQPTLARARRKGLLVPAPTDDRSLSIHERGYMLPPRPHALAPDQIIDRRRLFARFRGLLTYGCPLERFRVLWPDIIPINRESETNAAAFQQNQVDWINLFDPSDPVSSVLKSFAPQELESHPAPKNIAYRSPWLHLASHISYLRLRPGPCAARACVSWILEQDASAWDAVGIGAARQNFRQGLQYATWFVILALGLLLLSAASHWFDATLPIWGHLLLWLGLAAVVVLASGPVLWLVQRRAEKRHELRRTAARALVRVPVAAPQPSSPPVANSSIPPAPIAMAAELPQPPDQQVPH